MERETLGQEKKHVFSSPRTGRSKLENRKGGSNGDRDEALPSNSPFAHIQCSGLT